MKPLTLKKTLSRIAAIQAIYSNDIKDHNMNPEALFSEILNYHDKEQSEENEVDELDKKHLSRVIENTLSNIHEIDDLISKHLTDGRKLEGLHILIKSVLRAAICELKYFDSIPTKVVINEYTNIASEFFSDIEIGFVNSIIDKISSEVRK